MNLSISFWPIEWTQPIMENHDKKKVTQPVRRFGLKLGKSVNASRVTNFIVSDLIDLQH
jgi:hypothetical protein